MLLFLVEYSYRNGKEKVVELIKFYMSTSKAPVTNHYAFHEIDSNEYKLGHDWLKAAGHERSRSKKCWPYLQRLNAAIASVHKPGVSSVNGPRHDETNKVTMRPAKTQISLSICTV